MKRRKFLNVLLGLLGSTTMVTFAYPLVKFLAPPEAESKTRKLVVKKSEIPIGEAKAFTFNNTPVIVINRPDKGFIALSKVCTHLGCLVTYERGKKILLCPCHAGVYDIEGNVVSGPPPKPLQKFPVRVEGENVVIG